MSDQAQPQSPGQESLRRSLEIEYDAQDLMRAADERAEELVSNAKQKAGGILAGARTRAQKEAETLIQEAKAEAEEEAGQLLETVRHSPLWEIPLFAAGVTGRPGQADDQHDQGDHHTAKSNFVRARACGALQQLLDKPAVSL